MDLDDSKQRFVRLLTHHERMVYSYILRLVVNWNDADEILQETNVRLWEEFDRFEPGSNFGAWAIRVAHYQVLTWRKRRARNRLIFDDATLESLAIDRDDDSTHDDARRAALAACLQQLPEKSRALLSRCYAADTTIRDAALELRRSTEAVYKALQRIRLSLHACIDRRLAGENAT